MNACGLLFDDGITPGGREMDAARHAGARSPSGLRPSAHFDATTHLGGIVGIDEPDRAIIEREQEALAFLVGIDLVDGASLAAACLRATRPRCCRGRSCPLATSVRITCVPSATRARKRPFKAVKFASICLWE